MVDEMDEELFEEEEMDSEDEEDEEENPAWLGLLIFMHNTAKDIGANQNISCDALGLYVAFNDLYDNKEDIYYEGYKSPQQIKSLKALVDQKVKIIAENEAEDPVWFCQSTEYLGCYFLSSLFLIDEEEKTLTDYTNVFACFRIIKEDGEEVYLGLMIDTNTALDDDPCYPVFGDQICHFLESDQDNY